ncbi:MAG: aspartyl protease family protein [Sphingomicrobium sp.]
MPILALVAATALATHTSAAADPPKIARPRPAPANLPPRVPPLPTAEIDNALAVSGEQIKAHKETSRLSVDVLVNGRGPYQFVVDSGADTSAVGLQIARRLELPLGSPAILNGMTSRDLVDRVKVAELSFGHSAIRDLELPALRELDLGGDGLLGIDALIRQRLLLDFEKKIIRVEDATKAYKPEPGEIVIVARRQHGQLILTKVRAASIPIDAVIDTGTEITIGNMALRNKLIRNNRKSFITVETIGVTGKSARLEIARVGQLDLGPVTLRDVPMAFADVPPFKLFGLLDEPAILLGTDVLEHFRKVSLDFRDRKARFQLRRCESTIVVFNSTNDFLPGRIYDNGTREACRN